MTITVKALYTGGQLTNSAATYVTGQSNVKTIITSAVFTNVSAATHTITVYLVRSGGSASDSNIIIGASAAGYSLTSGQAYVSPELPGVVLNAGDTIQAKADTGSVITLSEVSGYEVTT